MNLDSRFIQDLGLDSSGVIEIKATRKDEFLD